MIPRVEPHADCGTHRKTGRNIDQGQFTPSIDLLKLHFCACHLRCRAMIGAVVAPQPQTKQKALLIFEATPRMHHSAIVEKHTLAWVEQYLDTVRVNPLVP